MVDLVKVAPGSRTFLSQVILFDIASAVFSKSKDISDEDNGPHGIAWNNDGSKMYMIGSENNSIYEYNVSSSFDIATATFSKLKDVSGDEISVRDMAWNDDGSKLYVAGANSGEIHEYDVSTEFDIAFAVFSKSKDVSNEDLFPLGMAWNNDGSKMYVAGAENATIYEYDVSVSFDIAFAVFSKSKDVSNEDSSVSGMAWNNDGSKMYMVGFNSDNINEYDLSILFDIASAVFSKSKDVQGEDTSPNGVAWNNDGSKMYIVGSSSDNINEYDVG